MTYRRWLPVLLLVCSILYGCGQKEPPTVNDERIPGPVMVSTDLVPYVGLSGKEQQILRADTIVRGELWGMSTTTADWQEHNGSWKHVPILEFRFRVLEYLKGSGPDEIYAIVDTEDAARTLLGALQETHDARWDGREAILFLFSDTEPMPNLSADRFLMGSIHHDGWDTYGIASIHHKPFVPAAQTSGGAGTKGAASTEKSSDPIFLLDVPGSSSTGVISASTPLEADTSPTIRLSAMRTLITALEAEANAGGTDEYRSCVLEAYVAQQDVRNRIAAAGTAVQRFEYTIESGLPAGADIYHDRAGFGLPPDNLGKHWFEGPDTDLVAFRATDIVTTTAHFWTWGTEPIEILEITRWIVTARPLPAGNYRCYYNVLWAGRSSCDKFSEIERNLSDNYLTVTAPERTVHEAFFDPVAIGVLKPAAFTVGGASATITSLKWESGTVTMELNPSASLADHATDFIDVNGTTTLSLSIDDATQGGGGALTWSVANQPWQAGDLLMLRVAPAAE